MWVIWWSRETNTRNRNIGTEVSAEDVDKYLADDVEVALSNARSLYPDFDVLPSEVQLIIANMIFNLGYTGWEQTA